VNPWKSEQFHFFFQSKKNMKFCNIKVLFVLVLVLIIDCLLLVWTHVSPFSRKQSVKSPSTPPVAPRIPFLFHVQDRTIIDFYAWIFQKGIKDSNVIDYIQQENTYTTHQLKHTLPLQKELLKELTEVDSNKLSGRQTKDFYIEQFWETDYFTYYLVYFANKTYPAYYRRHQNRHCSIKHLNPLLDEVVLNYNLIISQNETYFLPGVFEVSPDDNYVAFSYDIKGNEQFTLNLMTIKTQKITFTLAYTYYSARWYLDKTTELLWLYYNAVDAVYGIPRHIFRLSFSKLEPMLVYEELDVSFTTELVSSADGSFVFIKVQSFLFVKFFL
jgi:oligopeptidase B